jgi:uncharacterized protein YsxB (DUF464 family)
MTHITLREYHDNILLIAEGHSGYGSRGADIVCAGISTLICALINTLLDEEASDRLRLVRKVIRDGYVCLEIKCFSFSYERINGIIDLFRTGLLMIGDSYPDSLIID